MIDHSASEAVRPFDWMLMGFVSLSTAYTTMVGVLVAREIGTANIEIVFFLMCVLSAVAALISFYKASEGRFSTEVTIDDV